MDNQERSPPSKFSNGIDRRSRTQQGSHTTQSRVGANMGTVGGEMHG